MQSVARFVARRYFFSGLVIADGTICDDCEKMVRGQFNIEEYYGRENWKISTSDPLKAMTVEELKDMINEKKAEQTQVVEEIGGDYAAIAKVEKTFGIAPKATDVGLKRAKALKNRIVATSYIMSGEFSRGDILFFLASYPGQVFTHRQIYETVWGKEYFCDEGNVTAHIGHIRKKIELDPRNPVFIQTVRGIGYKFAKK